MHILRPVPEHTLNCFPYDRLVDPVDVEGYLRREGIARIDLAVEAAPQEGILYVPQSDLVQLLLERGKRANLFGISDITRAEVIGTTYFVHGATHHSFALEPGNAPSLVHTGPYRAGVPLALDRIYVFDARLRELPLRTGS